MTTQPHTAQTQHTPGPWKIEVMAHTMRVTESEYPDDNNDIAVLGDCRDSRTQANARLIAAAPELLEALEMVLDSYCYWLPRYGDPEAANSAMVRHARAAIAKAKGQP